MDKMIDVSIAMMTYYHRDYISRAIESVLSQITDYTYEIVISDDNSKDGTVEILKEYKNKYPDIIVLNLNDHNLGISQNNYLTRTLCKGRYVATLSGDDYWIDPHKIQRQVTYLDSHPECFAVATTIEGRFDNETKPFQIFPPKKLRNTTIDLRMYLHGAIFGTNGMMMRNDYLTKEGREYFSIVKKASQYIDDATECILVLKKGNVFISDVPSVVYRVKRQKNGTKNFNSIYSTTDKIKFHIELYNNLYHLVQPPLDLSFIYRNILTICFLTSLSKFNFTFFSNSYKTIPEEFKSFRLLFGIALSSISIALKHFVLSIRRQIK